MNNKNKLKFLFTGPRDIYATPAFERSLVATKSVRGETAVVDWNDEPDIKSRKWPEYHFKYKKGIMGLLKWQWFLYSNMVKIKPDVVVNMSMLSFTPIVAYKLTKKIKVIYDCRDYLAVSYSFNFLSTQIIRLFDNLATYFSDLVIVPDSYGYKYFNLCKDTKIQVVPNTVVDTKARKKTGNGRVKLAYLGYLSLDRNIKRIFRFAEQNTDIEIHIACNYIPKKLKDTIPNLKNIIFHGRLPHEEAQRLLSEMDYCLLMYNPMLGNYQHIQPTKFYDCLALGLPYICSKGMINLEKHINNSTENISWEYDADMINLPLKKTKFSMYSRDLYSSKYEYKKVLDAYKQIIEEECKKL
jgi:hypothetical protein